MVYLEDDGWNEGLGGVASDDVEGLGWSVTGMRGEGIGGAVCPASRRNMRRSTMTLALRIETPRSSGLRCIGMGTRSSGPMGDFGELMEYRIRGARGLFVC